MGCAPVYKSDGSHRLDCLTPTGRSRPLSSLAPEPPNDSRSLTEPLTEPLPQASNAGRVALASSAAISARGPLRPTVETEQVLEFVQAGTDVRGRAQHRARRMSAQRLGDVAPLHLRLAGCPYRQLGLSGRRREIKPRTRLVGRRPQRDGRSRGSALPPVLPASNLALEGSKIHKADSSQTSYTARPDAKPGRPHEPTIGICPAENAP